RLAEQCHSSWSARTFIERLARRLGQSFQHSVEHVAAPPPVQRRYRMRLPQAEVPQCPRLSLGSGAVDLVRGHDDRLSGATKYRYHRIVSIGGTDGRID